jgi:transcriptional regulator with XRE-family HTH domain
MQLGSRIRQRRKALQMTLKQVAERTGLTAGFLSQLERHQTSTSLTSLVTIAQALEQPDQLRPASYSDQRSPFAIDNGPNRYERLSTVFPGSQLHSVKYRVPSGYKSMMESHAGDEWVFVLHGRVEYTVGTEQYILGVGDSLHFDARIAHSIHALPDPTDYAEVVWVGTAQLFDAPDSHAGSTHPFRGTAQDV